MQTTCYSTVLDNNPELTMAFLNLAMPTDKAYITDKVSSQQKFIGYGCLSSPSTSECFQRIGNVHTLSLEMTKACATCLQDGEFLALDGTRIDRNSENISLVVIGKKKGWFIRPSDQRFVSDQHKKMAILLAIEPMQVTSRKSAHWTIYATCGRTPGFLRNRL